jgi:hypothetical protein
MAQSIPCALFGALPPYGREPFSWIRDRVQAEISAQGLFVSELDRLIRHQVLAHRKLADFASELLERGSVSRLSAHKSATDQV